ncbi:unnamed protein product [Leptidea sinapis]|uniref:Salivary secreted peptide n=1 Tax=Leptidea sinapis TaxID=189913 RepID=A0A5E4PM67_9NEOP|nr:unnamed protein product [Leptidea sinapis]
MEMKSLALLVFTLLSVNLVCSAVPLASRSHLNVGYIYPGDRLLYRQYLQKLALPNAIQYQDFIYQGNRSTRISAVTATEIGYTQYASAWIIRGGVGYNNVTVRVQTYRGYGYYYVIDVWGR